MHITRQIGGRIGDLVVLRNEVGATDRMGRVISGWAGELASSSATIDVADGFANFPHSTAGFGFIWSELSDRVLADSSSLLLCVCYVIMPW